MLLLFAARGSGVGYNWCAYIYAPEAYPTEIRAVTFGIGVTFMRIGGMVTPYFAQVLMAYSSTFALSVYIVSGLIGTILPLLLPIETMGLDLSVSSEKSKLLQ